MTTVTRPTVTDTYQYDANGNTLAPHCVRCSAGVTCRVEKSITYLQTYNLENRISTIAKLASGTCAAPGNYAAKPRSASLRGRCGTLVEFTLTSEAVSKGQ